MAAAPSAQTAELQRALTALVTRRWGADGWRAAFGAYDRDGNGVIDRGELTEILTDAGVGNFLTRAAWADGVLGELDKNKDAGISWDELQSVLVQRTGPAATAPVPSSTPSTSAPGPSKTPTASAPKTTAPPPSRPAQIDPEVYAQYYPPAAGASPRSSQETLFWLLLGGAVLASMKRRQ